MKKVISWITGMLLLLSTAACGGPVSAATDLSGSGTESSQDSVPDQNSEENSGVIMEPGMMFTIEPMVNMGSDEVYTDEEDDWTVRTEDGLPSAQWEVTVLVTEDGCEVICW